VLAVTTTSAICDEGLTLKSKQLLCCRCVFVGGLLLN